MEQYKNLPIFQDVKIVQSNPLDHFKKGEKPINGILKLIVIGGLGYGGYLTAIHIVPAVFIALGQVLAAVATGLALLFTVIMIPAFFKLCKRISSKLSDWIVRTYPFEELYDQLQIMYDQVTKFVEAKAQIQNLEKKMKDLAKDAESKVAMYRDKIQMIKRKVDSIREDKQMLLQKLGPTAEENDEFVHLQIEEKELLNTSNETISLMKQSEDYIVKYGARHAIIKKTRQNLMRAESAMKVKVSKFKTSIEMMENDYKFAAEGRAATEAMKGAMMFTTTKEAKLAIDVVQSSIARDLAITASNLDDINSLAEVTNYDNQELFDRLSKVADSFAESAAPTADKFFKADVKLTESEKSASGLDSLFKY